MQYQAVVFDFFGVVCSEVAPFWLRRHFAEGDAGHLKASLVRAADAGMISQAQMFTQLSSMTGVSASKIESEWFDLAHVDRKTVALCKRLKARVKLGLLTNSPADFVRGLLARDRLDVIFDSVVVSSEVHCTKPDPRTYSLILEKLMVEAQDALMIDDNSDNVHGAVQVGMKGILFHSAEELEVTLCDLL